MKTKKVTIINKLNKYLDCDLIYIVNKLYERAMIDKNEKKQAFRVNQSEYVICEHINEKEIVFTITDTLTRKDNDLLGLM